MPLPDTTSISTLMRFLAREKPNMPKKQRLAIALEKAGKSKKRKDKKKDA